MTEIDIIREAVQTLGGLSIPVGLTETLGIPIYNVRGNLIALLNAINEQRTRQEAHAEPVPEPIPEPEEPKTEEQSK